MADDNDFPADRIQYVTLNDARIAGVFVAATEDYPQTRVLYDMTAMAATLASELIPKALVARLSGDETEMARVEGAKWVIDSIVASRDTLLLEAQFALPDAEDPQN